MNLLPQLDRRSRARFPRKLYWRYHFNAQRALRDGDMKYLKIAGNEFLFNVADDPLERANLKERQPDVFKRMAQAYDGVERDHAAGDRRRQHRVRWAMPMSSPITLACSGLSRLLALLRAFDFDHRDQRSKAFRRRRARPLA